MTHSFISDAYHWFTSLWTMVQPFFGSITVVFRSSLQHFIILHVIPLCDSEAWVNESTHNEDHTQVRIPSIPHFWWLTDDYDDALATNGDTSSLLVHAPFHHTSTPNHFILNMINIGRELQGRRCGEPSRGGNTASAQEYVTYHLSISQL